MFSLLLFAVATVFQVNGVNIPVESTITKNLPGVGTVIISLCKITCANPVTKINGRAILPTCASEWCFGAKAAWCRCIDRNFPFLKVTDWAHADCTGPPQRRLSAATDDDITSRRRLEFTESDLTNAELDCFQNEFCMNMLIGYEIGPIHDTVTSRRMICESSEGCSDETFALFNAAADDGDCTEPCVGMNSFEYINDGVARTAAQAQELCRSEYDSNLATIRDMDDLLIAVLLINDGPSPWIGLQSGLTSLRHHFRYVDGSDCPIECDGQEADECDCSIGECVCSSLWLNNASLPCAIGSKCTRIVPEAVKISNDKHCKKDTLSAVLCNCVGSAS